MSTSALAPAAQDEIATLFVGFELSKATWLIGLYSPQLGKTISRYKVDGGDVDAALERITVARLRLEKLGKPVRVVSIYEAGYDGFWLHRRLTAAGIENRVVDAASIPVERRSRRRKTDRIDLELLIRMLLALERGETRIHDTPYLSGGHRLVGPVWVSDLNRLRKLQASTFGTFRWADSLRLGSN